MFKLSKGRVVRRRLILAVVAIAVIVALADVITTWAGLNFNDRAEEIGLIGSFTIKYGFPVVVSVTILVVGFLSFFAYRLSVKYHRSIFIFVALTPYILTTSLAVVNNTLIALGHTGLG